MNQGMPAVGLEMTGSIYTLAAISTPQIRVAKFESLTCRLGSRARKG